MEGPIRITLGTRTQGGPNAARERLEPYPPYGSELAEMNTFLNHITLASARMAALTTDSHYPEDIGGLSAGIVAVDTTNIDNSGNPFPALSGALPPEGLVPGQQIIARLSESAYGYFVEDELRFIARTEDGDPEDLNKLPPYAMKVMLPAGTRFTISSDDTAVRFPANVNLPSGAAYNPAEGTWTVPGDEIMVEIVDRADKWVTLNTPPGPFPREGGGCGLPARTAPGCLG